MFEDRSVYDELKENAKEDEEVDGWNGIKYLFRNDFYGRTRPQLTLVMQATGVCFVFGAAIGAVNESKKVYTKFILENQATKFDSHTEAKRVIMDKMMLAYMRGGVKLGWRMGLFGGMAMFSMVAVEAFRGKSTPLDIASGGAVAGLLYKVKSGPKPMISGAVVGGAFGLMGGVTLHSLLWLTGFTMKDLYKNEGEDCNRISDKEWNKELEQRKKEEKESDPLVHLHNLTTKKEEMVKSKT